MVALLLRAILYELVTGGSPVESSITKMLVKLHVGDSVLCNKIA